MSSRPSSRATTGEETTTSLRSNTAKRPVTKPVAPRLSSAGTATKPTSTSSTRPTSSVTSTLHKPPTRPATTSAVKRPPSSTATATSSVHRARPSIASADASADESKRNGITARPKRMSLASTTNVDKPGTSASRTTAATPARRTLSTATSATARPSVRSPTSTTKTPSPTAARTTSALTSRTRPLPSSTTRPVTTLTEKKRLSTVPASPAVRRAGPREDEDATNEELQDVNDAPVDENVGNDKADDGTTSNAEITVLRDELEESQSQVQELKSHLAEITARMEYFSKSAEDESMKVQEATQAIRLEHESKIDHMSSLYKSQIEELEASYQKRIEEAVTKHEAEIATLNEDNSKTVTNKVAEIEGLKSELDKAKASVHQTGETVSTPDSEELVEVRKQLEAAHGRHLAAKDNAKSKMAKALEEHSQTVRELNTQHAEEIADMQKQVNEIQALRSQNEDLAKANEAHVETRNLLQTVKNELESVKTEKRSNDEQHSMTINDLKERLATSNSLQNQVAADAESSISKLKIEHDERLKVLEAKLKAAERELQANVDLSEQHYTEAMQKLKDDLETSQKQLTDTLSERESSTAEYETSLKAAKEAAALAEKSLREEISALRGQLNEATSTSESNVTKLEEDLKALRSKLEAKEDEIKALEASQDSELSNIRSKISIANEATISSLKEAHAAEVSRVEAEAKAALRDVQELKASNSTQADEIRSQADIAQKSALDEQASLHRTAVSELENKLESVHSQINDLKRSHEEEMTSHFKTAEDEAKKLRVSHADELQKSQSKVKDMAGELDAAKFQVQSLKSILQDMEQEFKTKEEEIQKELEGKNEEFSQAVMKLSAQSTRIIELETAHKQAVELAKAAVEAETQASLDTLKQEHDTAFDEMKKDLEAKHLSTLQTLHSEHSHAIEMLTKEVDVREYNIESLKAEHAQALEDLRSSSDQGSAEALEKQKLEHEAFVDELMSKHAARINEESEQSKNHLNQVKAEYENVITSLQAEANELRDKATDTSESDSLNTKLSASQQAFTKLQEEHATMMSNISKEHAIQLATSEEKLKAFEAKANKPVDTTELDDLRSSLAQEKAKTAELANAHTTALNTKDHEHTKAIETLQSELTDAKVALSSAARESENMKEVKSLLADAQRTVQELSEQYSIATVDAEHQRLAAENAKKELADLKKSLNEASALPKTTPEPSQPPANTKGSLSNAKPGPKAGLKASKWATEDPEPAPAADEQLKDLGVDEGLPTEIAAPAEPPKPKSRNVAGQVAGIQEQIRQLSELNDEFLSDHQKWARTLNQVDEDGTVTVSVPQGETAPEAGNGDGKVSS